MVLKTADIVTLYHKIAEISQRKELNIPVKLSFRLLRNGKIIEPLALSFDEVANNTLMKYSSAVEGEGNEGKMSISTEDLKKVQTQIKELEDEEVEVPLLPIKLSEIDGLNLTMQDLAGLYPIIENEEA